MLQVDLIGLLLEKALVDNLVINVSNVHDHVDVEAKVREQEAANDIKSNVHTGKRKEKLRKNHNEGFVSLNYARDSGTGK